MSKSTNSSTDHMDMEEKIMYRDDNKMFLQLISFRISEITFTQKCFGTIASKYHFNVHILCFKLRTDTLIINYIILLINLYLYAVLVKVQ